MKIGDIRNLSQEELLRQEHVLREELFKLRFKHSIGQLSKTADIHNKRKELSKVLTVIKERMKNEK